MSNSDKGRWQPADLDNEGLDAWFKKTEKPTPPEKKEKVKAPSALAALIDKLCELLD